MKSKSLAPKLFPDLNAYGNEVRHSALADCVELEAVIKGHSLSQADLQDYLADKSLESSIRDSYFRSDDPLEERSDIEGLGIFDVCRERSSILGDRYPFQVSGNRLHFNPDSLGQTYLQLLAITLAHAYGIEKTDVLFENMVSQYLTSLGLKVFRTGGYRNQFEKLVRDCGTSLGLPTSIANVQHRKRANDEGVDCLGLIGLNDRRIGQWILAGQITVGKSGSWKGKASEPKLGLWSKIFLEQALLLPFLALPHHVPIQLSREIWDLRTSERTLVLDRLRLCFGVEQSSEANEILEKVKQTDFDWN